MIRVLISLALIAGFGFAQDGGSDEVVLRVQGTEVTKSEFDRRFNFYVANLAAQQGVPLTEESRPMFEEMRPQYVEQLTTETAVLQIGRALGLNVDETFVDEQVATIRANFDDEEAFLNAMEGAGIGDEAFLRVLVRDAELSRQTVAALREGLELRDYQVQLFYEANRASLERPAQTCARHILVETLDEAEEIMTELDDGASFETLAQENSIDPGSGPQGGDLGCFGPGRMVPVFEEAAFTTPVGTVSAPVESDFGFHLVLPYDRQEASTVPLEEVEPQLRDELGRQIVRLAIEGYVEGADVEIFEDRLSSGAES